MTDTLRIGRDALALASMKIDEITEAINSLQTYIHIAQENLAEHYPEIDEPDNDLDTMDLPVKRMLRKAGIAQERIESVRKAMREVEA